MRIERLWLRDFRSYREAELMPAPAGLTVVTGANGAGKTNLLEAIGYLATLRSFRGAPGEALVRVGEPRAVVRAEVCWEARRVLIEAELHPTGRDRVQVNRQPLRRSRDLLGAVQVTVFTPEDLGVVKGPPQGRRQYLDDLLVALHPRHDATIGEVERVLRQRNTLLKQAGGRASPEVTTTLAVWDAKLATAGEDLAAARAGLVEALQPLAAAAYARLAGQVGPAGDTGLGEGHEVGAGAARGEPVCLAYAPSWEGSLLDALAAARPDDLRRGVTTVGPHRDELHLRVAGLPSRTHASQGEQRSLALALRLAGHQLVTGRVGSSPVLLLDDVFSELDAARAAALLDCLPPGQAILTTAGELPAGAEAAARARVEDGRLW